MEIPEKLVEKQVDKLEEKEGIEAVAVVGSYARNPKGIQNSLNLLVVADEEEKRSEVVDDAVVKKFFRPLDSWKDACEAADWWKIYRWTQNWDKRFDPKDLLPEIEEKAEEVKKERLETDEEDREEIAYTLREKKQDLDSEDVAQRRYLMNEFFDYLLHHYYILEGVPPVKSNYRIEKLEEFSGYMYKLSQDFLLASSTMDKQQVLEKIVDYVSRELPEIGPEWED